MLKSRHESLGLVMAFSLLTGAASWMGFGTSWMDFGLKSVGAWRREARIDN